MNKDLRILLPRLPVAEATEEISSNVDVCEKRNTTRNSSGKVDKLYKFIFVTALCTAYCTADSADIITQTK